MKLTEATAVIRPRGGWEAVDLGIRMVQRDFWALSRRWLVATLPWYVLFVTSAHLMGDVGLGVVLFWWMKPAFDRVVLDYLSQRLFSTSVEEPGPFDLWFRLPFSFAVWRQLTYLRLSLARSFTLPVYQLEGASKDSASRIRTLINRDYGVSAWLTLVFAFLTSLLLWVVLSQLTQWLHPDPIILEDADLFEALFELEALFTGTLFWLHLIIFYVITSVFELFFVGAGFGLYLNRRTHLEAWDIELSFRRLAQRLGRSAVALVGAMLLAGALVPPVAHAQSEDDTTSFSELPHATDARNTAEQIYAGDEFGEHIQDRVWRKRESEVDEHENVEIDLDFLSSVAAMISFLATVFKYLVIAAVAIALAWWLYRERDRLLKRRSRRAAPEVTTEVVAAEEEDDFIPDANVPDVVLRLWSEQKPRESLSYLYRSALAFLVQKHNILIGDHATEEDCLNLVRRKASERVSQYFAEITRQWRLLAYGKRLPETATVEQLCAHWDHLADVKLTRPSGELSDGHA